MNRLVILIIILNNILLFPNSNSSAATTEAERRIEEEKRESLSISEAVIAVKDEDVLLEDEVNDIYFEALLPRKVTYISDAFKILVILLGVENKYADFESQKDFLIERQVVPQKIQIQNDPYFPLRKGTLSFMICRTLGIKGGLHLRVFPKSERYSLKELEYLGIVKNGYVNDLVSGEELIKILTRSADYLAGK